MESSMTLEEMKSLPPDEQKALYQRLHKVRKAYKPVNYCLPMYTKVLTEGGWKFYGDISVNDSLPVYDKNTGTVLMGKVLEKHFYEDTEVYSYRNKESGFSCTENHEWFNTQRRCVNGVRYYNEPTLTKADNLNTESNVLLTAPYVGGNNPNVSKDDAFFMGLLLSDGSYFWSKSLGGTSNSHGKRRHLKMMVGQSKNKYYKEVEESLDKLGLTHTKGVVTKDNGNDVYIYSISSGPARDFLDRVMDIRADRDEYNWTSWVLSLTRESLEAFYEGFYLGDGDVKGLSNGISQNEGKMADGIVAAMQLMGNGRVTYTGKTKCKFIREHKTKHLTWQRVKKVRLLDQNTFCLTTTGGSFIIWQGDSVGITGNSAVYGVGVPKLMRSTGMTRVRALSLLEAYWERNSAVKKVAKEQYVKEVGG